MTGRWKKTGHAGRHTGRAERTDCPAEKFQSTNHSAGTPMNGAFAEELKLLKEYWGNSPGDVYFSPKDGYAMGKNMKSLGKLSQRQAKELRCLKLCDKML